ncbi:hypothetical protein [Cryptosporangium aurantiacum]|uniref:Uncharacterized protein n=1 Tax=Cryptosporangium aurantiacum TaxID=134849 RepID=A0A1M7RJU5_9ACTN|nr:hypothetical protein [Cryptosporangium aurantiacum]SHN46615.1 hypothetical protein SAMN05443668_116151 [Cryptosporangium aurantiacum]
MANAERVEIAVPEYVIRFNTAAYREGTDLPLADLEDVHHRDR